MKPRLLLAGVFAFLMITGLGLLARWPARADSGVRPASGQSDLGLVHLAQVDELADLPLMPFKAFLPFIAMQPATARSGPQLVLVGQVDVGGPAYAVTVQGDYAYVGAGNRLVVVDVSDPTTPQVMGQTAPFSDSVAAVVVTGTHAYVAAYTAGLRVVDISDPAAPQEVGFYDTPGMALDVDVAGSYAYVADGDGGLRVVDVFTPTALQEVGFLDRPYAASVQVVGGYIYLTTASVYKVDTLEVIDVSNPTLPQRAGYVILNVFDAITDLSVSGNYAYLIEPAPPGCVHFCFPGRLSVVDISTPASPQYLSSADRSALFTLAIYVLGDYAYLAGNYGLVIYDVSDPTYPSLSTTSYVSGYGGNICAVDEFVYVANGEGGLAIWWFGPDRTAASKLQAAADH
jgi:hypothetical protein